MLEFARLEWRKDRMLFGGMAAAFLLSLPIVGVVARLNHHPASQGLDGALLFWTFVGLPIVALVFGAAIASGLRRDPALAAEALLPMSPRARTFGAAAAGLAGLIGMIVLVLGVSAAISPDWRVAVTQHEFAAVMVLPYFSVELFVVVHLFLLAFAIAFLSEHGVAGAAAAIPLGGLTAAALTRDYALHAVFGARAPLWPTLTVMMFASAGAAVAVIRWAAPWRQRLEKKGWRLGFKMAAVLAGGALISFIGAGTYNHRIARSPQLLTEQVGGWNRLRSDAASALSQKAAGAGVLMDALDGSLVRVLADGTVQPLIAAGAHGENDLLADPHGSSTMAVAVDAKARLWVVRKAGSDGLSEVWSGPISGPLRRRASFSGIDTLSLDATQEPVAVFGRASRPEFARWLWTTVDEDGSPLRWRTEPAVDSINGWIRRHRAEAGAAAFVGQDGRSLSLKMPDGRTTRWRLPGYAKMKDPVVMEFVGGAKVFLVPISISKDRMALAVCRENAVVELVWKDERYVSQYWYDNPDGSMWSDENGRFLIISAEGRFLPPLRVAEKYPGLPIHQEGDFVWFDDGPTIAKRDLTTGEVVASWSLPDKRPMTDHFLVPLKAVHDGYFVRTPRGLFFYDWDGRRRRIPFRS